MRNYNDIGFIIKVKPLKDADKLVVLITKNHGRVEAVAKGAAKILSRKGRFIDLLNHVAFSAVETKGLDIITEMDIAGTQITNDISNLSIISQLFYIAELTEKFSYVDENNSNTAYELLLYLSELDTHEKTYAKFLNAFELKLLDIHGFTPNLTEYVDTGNDLIEGKQFFLSDSDQLGYCEYNKNNIIESISSRIIKIQKFFLTNTIAKAVELKIEMADIATLSKINQFWLEATLENRLQSTNFLARYNKYE